MTRVPRPLPPKPGRQAERTALAWERSAFSFLGIAALVLFREQGPLAQGRTVLAAAAILLAVLVLALGRMRGRRMLGAGQPDIPVASVAVRVLGWSTACLAVAILVVLVLPA